MPIYEYRCPDCEQVFEEWQSDYTERELPCPVCNGASKRLISHTSFVLKGTGWYTTDYCRPTSGNAGNGNGNGNGTASESKTGDAPKPASGGGAESASTGTAEAS